MKRWITAGLALLLILSVAGCSGGMTPEQRFEAVMQQSAELSSMECDAQTRMKMAFEGNALEMTMDMSIKMNRDGDRIEMAMVNTTDLMGQQIVGENYYKDGYLYTSMLGQSFAMPFDVEMLVEQVKAQNLQALSVDDLDSFKLEQNGKEYAFYYSVKPEQLNAQIDQLLSLIGSGLFPADSIKVTAVNGSLVADRDNNIKSQLMRMSMQVSLGGETMDIAVEMDYRYQNVGGTVVVEFPADLESYALIG